MILLFSLIALVAQEAEPGPFQATGIKIGEVTASSAIVWTRLTEKAAREPGVWAVPGIAGQVRLSIWPADAPAERRETGWVDVDAERDFTHQFAVAELASGTVHELVVEARADADSAVSSRAPGRFRTAYPGDESAPVTFTVVTGQDFHRRDDGGRGHALYKAMGALDPDFFVHTGDIVYYDKPEPVALDVPTARVHWQRTYSFQNQREFHARVASYFEKDDHDTLKDDCWPGQRKGDLTFADGVALFREQVPMGESTYRSIRWGKDLEIWLTEGRDFRSSNRDPDGPDKSILGATQLAWLQRTMSASDATFRVLINPTPIIGPDRKSKADNHSNAAFAHEGRLLRSFLGSLGNAVVVCGDRHWQYVSEDPATGLVEFSTGPTTDRHAGGFRESDRTPAHRFLEIAGGFLEVSVLREDGVPRLELRHRDVAGAVRHEVVIGPD